ncbi:MAG: N-acetylmuramoyl-L-alanine amidase [Alphaproteobacteria bacterium]|nr:N-acetylmuramoyl-L-alanine amidase [Alphaproteobacteria bacterium]
MLRLLALGVAGGWALNGALAQPAARGAAPLRRKRIIAIDPGHGGVDPGAISPDGACEKDIALATALEFARQLTATRRYRIVLTRGADEFVPLHNRVARARARRAELFLSIHADALPDRKMRGLSVFTQSAQASDREAAALAASENRADLIGGVRLAREPRAVANVLMDLARRETSNLAIVLARDIVDALSRVVVLRDRPQRSADFAVLTAPDIPSALIELGCLSNRKEERLLQRPAYRRKLSRALVRAVDTYFAHAAG